MYGNEHADEHLRENHVIACPIELRAPPDLLLVVEGSVLVVPHLVEAEGVGFVMCIVFWRVSMLRAAGVTQD